MVVVVAVLPSSSSLRLAAEKKNLPLRNHCSCQESNNRVAIDAIASIATVKLHMDGSRMVYSPPVISDLFFPWLHDLQLLVPCFLAHYGELIPSSSLN